MAGRYEIYTYEYLLQRALDRVPPTLDKREGSIIYDAIAPACYELAEVYMELETIFKQTFADTSTEDNLTLRAAELGVYRTAATAAVRKGTFNTAVPLGSRFMINNLRYSATKQLTATTYELTCEETGTIGNMYSGTLTMIDYIAGLETAAISDILVSGEDIETDDALRTRYYAELQASSFGGNVNAYKTFTTELAGVGGTKVYPIWAGGGTVKLVIIDSDYNVPSGTLLTVVQTAVDPAANAGEGMGIAPIGHLVTVAGVTGTTANIAMTVTLQGGYLWADVVDFIITNIEAYLLQLRQSWAAESALVVRISQLESATLQVTGIVDVTGTTINGVAANLVLGADNVPILGTVTQI